ncbi:hypothetical protein VCHC17A1_1576B, partial [Vibrio cholerae HC-17A1]
RRAA